MSFHDLLKYGYLFNGILFLSFSSQDTLYKQLIFKKKYLTYTFSVNISVYISCSKIY